MRRAVTAEVDARDARPPLTVLYDADCGVCRLTILALLRLDWRHRLDVVPLGSFAAVPPEEAPTVEELRATLHVRDEDGRWSRGGAAALRIAGALPLLVPLALAGQLPGLAWLAERSYDAVAAHRGAISHALGLERCAIGLKPAADG